MPPRVLIADNSEHPFLSRPSSHWEAHLNGVKTVAVNIPSGQGSPSLSGFTHLILTGSEGSILRPEPWFEAEVELVRRAVERGLRVIGSCFGHQLLVYALSGPEYLHPADPPEVGFTPVGMTGPDPLFDRLPNPWTTFVYHFDAVIDPPPHGESSAGRDTATPTSSATGICRSGGYRPIPRSPLARRGASSGLPSCSEESRYGKSFPDCAAHRRERGSSLGSSTDS